MMKALRRIGGKVHKNSFYFVKLEITSSITTAQTVTNNGHTYFFNRSNSNYKSYHVVNILIMVTEIYYDFNDTLEIKITINESITSNGNYHDN